MKFVVEQVLWFRQWILLPSTLYASWRMLGISVKWSLMPMLFHTLIKVMQEAEIMMHIYTGGGGGGGAGNVCKLLLKSPINFMMGLSQWHNSPATCQLHF